MIWFAAAALAVSALAAWLYERFDRDLSAACRWTHERSG